MERSGGCRREDVSEGKSSFVEWYGGMVWWNFRASLTRVFVGTLDYLFSLVSYTREGTGTDTNTFTLTLTLEIE